MFTHVFLYKLKEMFRMKWCIGWNLVFPIVLATAFYMGFGNFIREGEEKEVTQVAVVKESDTSFTEILKRVDFLEIKWTKEEEAKRLLKKGRVDGIFYGPKAEGDQPKLVINENGVGQTLLSQFLKSYNLSEFQVKTLMESGKVEDISKAISLVSQEVEYGEEITGFGSYKKEEEISPYMQYFFALIAMASLFSAWLSEFILKEMLASQSEIGKRYECGPIKRSITILAAILAGFVIEILCNVILVCYIQFVLKLSFHAPLFYVFFISCLAGTCGIAFGIFFGILCAGKENLMVTIPLTFSMICSFFSGLMVGNIQQLIQNKMPIINKINPAAVLSDGLYSIGTYGLGREYWVDVAILLGMTFACMLISSIILRRKSYASL